jgi:hypothetical protein
MTCKSPIHTTRSKYLYHAQMARQGSLLWRALCWYTSWSWSWYSTGCRSRSRWCRCRARCRTRWCRSRSRSRYRSGGKSRWRRRYSSRCRPRCESRWRRRYSSRFSPRYESRWRRRYRSRWRRSGSRCRPQWRRSRSSCIHRSRFRSRWCGSESRPGRICRSTCSSSSSLCSSSRHGHWSRGRRWRRGRSGGSRSSCSRCSCSRFTARGIHRSWSSSTGTVHHSLWQFFELDGNLPSTRSAVAGCTRASGTSGGTRPILLVGWFGCFLDHLLRHLCAADNIVRPRRQLVLLGR